MSDYVQMWKDLGMDLETHDLLCQVLPTAVGDVFLTQENRPKAMDFWDLVISEVHGIRPAELIAAQKEGRKVFGTFCVYVPDEEFWPQTVSLRVCVAAVSSGCPAAKRCCPRIPVR